MKTAWEDKTAEELVKLWADKKYSKKAVRDRNIRYLNHYLRFRRLNAKEVLDEQVELLHSRVVPLKLLEFMDYFQKVLKYSESGAVNATNAIRSYYKFWGVPLLIQKGDIEPSDTVYQDYDLTLDDIRQICAACDARGRAIILTGESLGWREGDIGQLKREHVEPFLKKEPPILVKLETEKEKVLARGFLHKTAIEAIRNYLATRTDSNEYLFVTSQRGIKQMRASAFNKIIQDGARRANIDTGAYRLRFHCLRKFLIGRLQDVGTEENVWKQLVGKETPERTYSTKKLREAYLKVLPLVDFSVSGSNHARVEELEEKVRKLERMRMTELLTYFGEELIGLRKELAIKSVPAKTGGTMEPIKLSPEEQLTLMALGRALRRIWDEQANENNH